MKLEVIERFTLLGALPTEGNLLTMMLIKDLREAFGFDDAERKRLGFEQEGQELKWDPEAKAVEIDIPGPSKQVVIDALKKLDEAKTVTHNHLSLFEKFINAPDLKVVEPQEE